MRIGTLCGFERSQAVTVVHQQFKRVLGVGRIVLGPAGLLLNASRYFAKVAGLIGKSTKKSYFCSA